jgi:SAM-dependent methyltransferase
MSRAASDGVDDRAAVRDLVLPPFRALLDTQPGIQLHDDPYQGPFEGYHHHATAAQTWDLDAIAEVVRAHGGPVLDIGCGRGRLALHLAGAGHPVTAVDTAPQATARLRAELAGRDGAEAVDVRTGDIRDPDLLPSGRFAVAALADLSVNLFTTGAAVDDLLTAVRRVLRPGGVLCLPVLHPHALRHYTRLRGVLASPYADDAGRQWLVWVAMRYDDTGGPHFHRTLFTQDDTAPDGTLRGHLTGVRERLWTTTDLRPHLDNAGFRTAERHPLHIPTHQAPAPAELLVVQLRDRKED